MNPLEKEFTLVDALTSLRPGSEWYCQSPLTLDNVVWQDPNNTLPSQGECDTEIERLRSEYEAREYQRIRAPQYPSIADQLDMLWHAMDSGALPKVDSFYSAIKAVKDQNPKP